MGSPPATLSGVGMVIVAAAIDGLSLAGVVLFAIRRVRRNDHILTEPGEWLLAIMGTRLVLHLLLQTYLKPTFQNPGVVLDGFICALLVLPTLDRKLPALWKLLFGLLAMLYLLPLVIVGTTIVFNAASPLLMRLSSTLQHWRGLVTWGFVLAFCWFDVRTRRTERLQSLPTPEWSWLHWVGIAACLAAVFSSWLLS